MIKDLTLVLLNGDEEGSQLCPAMNKFRADRLLRHTAIKFSKDLLALLQPNLAQVKFHFLPTGSIFLDDMLEGFDISYKLEGRNRGYYGTLYGMSVYFESDTTQEELQMPPFSCVLYLS
jgi:hypothetical protein